MGAWEAKLEPISPDDAWDAELIAFFPVVRDGFAVFVGATELTAVGRRAFSGDASFNGSTELAAAGRPVWTGDASLVGATELSLIGRRALSGDASFNGSSAVTARAATTEELIADDGDDFVDDAADDLVYFSKP